MIQSIKDYPLLYAVIGVVALGCGFLWFKAMQASKRRSGRREEIIAQLRRENRLKHEFRAPTQQLLEESEPARLVEGLCCWIQQRLEAQEDLAGAYDALEEPQRLIYALGYVIQDGGAQLSEFFRKNGQPLTGAAMEAAALLLEPAAVAVVRREYEAFDVEHEEVSLIAEETQRLDEEFRGVSQKAGALFYAKAKAYILENSSMFLD